MKTYKAMFDQEREPFSMDISLFYVILYYSILNDYVMRRLSHGRRCTKLVDTKPEVGVSSIGNNSCIVFLCFKVFSCISLAFILLLQI